MPQRTHVYWRRRREAEKRLRIPRTATLNYASNSVALYFILLAHGRRFSSPGGDDRPCQHARRPLSRPPTHREMFVATTRIGD